MVSGQEVLACLTHGEECFHGAGITLSQLPRLSRLPRLPLLAAPAARPLRKSELGSGSGRLGRTVHRQTDASPQATLHYGITATNCKTWLAKRGTIKSGL